MFITAVCVLFLIKLQWPRPKGFIFFFFFIQKMTAKIGQLRGSHAIFKWCFPNSHQRPPPLPSLIEDERSLKIDNTFQLPYLRTTLGTQEKKVKKDTLFNKGPRTSNTILHSAALTYIVHIWEVPPPESKPSKIITMRSTPSL